MALRRDLAQEIRRGRPDVLLIATYDLTYGLGAGQRIANQADHRSVGVATLDAARDAGNQWIFPELADEGVEPWPGVRHEYLMGSNEPTHAVDVTDTLTAGVESLQAHRTYLDGLGRDFDPIEFLEAMTRGCGRRAQGPHRRRLRPRPVSRHVTGAPIRPAPARRRLDRGCAGGSRVDGEGAGGAVGGEADLEEPVARRAR